MSIIVYGFISDIGLEVGRFIVLQWEWSFKASEVFQKELIVSWSEVMGEVMLAVEVVGFSRHAGQLLNKWKN